MNGTINPFYFRELPVDGPFCNREKELDELVRHGKSLANVVMFSPRRFGKTSLIRRVQRRLAEQGAITVYSQFFGVSSVEDVAANLAREVFRVTHPQESLFNKAVRTIRSFRPILVMRPDEEKGFAVAVELSQTTLSGADLLEDVMESLGKFISESGQLVHIALDEFQEITELPDALKIEGVLRQHIQRHQAAYAFIGSRRRVLQGMFNDRQRPFFQSAINYELQPLPREEFARFIAKLFSARGKNCQAPVAEYLVDLVERFPYYSQKLAYFVFEISGKTVEEEDVKAGLTLLLREESSVFEAMLMGLAPQQVALLRALATQPTSSIFAQDYLRRHRLGSVGGTQGAKKKLVLLDLIEEGDKRNWRVVDPVFAKWLQGRY
jgi:hypothetical protein